MESNTELQERGNRRARLGANRLEQFDHGMPYAVYCHTLYKGRWYYDGYYAFNTEHEARGFIQSFLRDGEGK